ncbi:MAG: lysine-sensitive aspartokinase 3, partial [Candidatus Micrarchaeia archaeon]
ANPKIVPEAHTIKHMSYEEAKELSFYGAKLHPKTIRPAMEKNIPVYILNTFNPDGEFTVITQERMVKENIVKGITCSSGNCVITISSPRMVEEYGFLAKIFNIFADKEDGTATAVDMISTSEASVSLTIKDTSRLEKIIRRLERIDGVSVKVEKNKSIICIVGEGMKHVPGTSGRLFSALGRAGINIEAIS